MGLSTFTRRLYGFGGYLVGGLVTPYMLLFAGDAIVPITVNTGTPRSPVLALAIDLGLIVMFGLQHSLMTLPSWKRWLTRRIPPPLERTVFVLAACLALVILMLAWQPIPGAVWHLDGIAADALTAGYVGGIVLVYVATLWLDHFHLLGLKQAWTGALDSGPDQLRITGPYRFMRHPLMTGLLAVFWITPHMTWGQLVFAAAMTIYVLVGTAHEERALRQRFGAAYASYARLTPMLTPLIVPTLLRYRARPTPAPTPQVRRPGIDYAPYGPSVWYGDNVVATAMMTAYSVLFPPLERFMVEELRAVTPDIRDPELARSVRAFTGQEGVHAREHARSLATLTGLGYRVRLLDRLFALATRYVLRPATNWIAKPLSGAAGSVAIFAGVEHWTATLAEMVLRQDYPRLPSPIIALYYWHAAEELEHKSVVADVLAHLGSSYPIRIIAFVVGTVAFAGLTAIGTVIVLAQIAVLQGRGVIGWLVYPARIAWDAVVFLFVREKLAWHIARGWLGYLVPFFHPHRRATDALVRRGLLLSSENGAALPIETTP